MPARPIIVIRLVQFVGWICVVLGAYFAMRTLSGLQGGAALMPFPPGSSFDVYVISFVPSILLVVIGLLCLVAGYALDALHDIRNGTDSGAG